MNFRISYPERLKCLITLGIIILMHFTVSAQSIFAGKEDLLSTPRQYVVSFNPNVPVMDGNLDDAVWQNAEWTENFKDIEGNKLPAPTWNTRVKMTWNDKGLYIAAEIMEPNVWAYLKKHDDIVFHDNDFEVFIDPDNDTHRYYEIEVNAVNTIFDLFMPKPYRNGSGALMVYNTPGLKSAVSIQGTVNKPGDTDKSWTVEMFVPFAALTFAIEAKAPVDGDFWRINFSRVQWKTDVQEGLYVKQKGSNGRNLPENNWVWSPQGVINMHFPERWGYLHFSKRDAGEPVKKYTIPYSEFQKKYLWLVYYLQKEYFQKNQKYAPSLKDLGINDPIVMVDNKQNNLWMESTSRQFMVYISSDENTYTVNDEGLVQHQVKLIRK